MNTRFPTLRLVAMLFASIALVPALPAQEATPAPTANQTVADITALLNDFLAQNSLAEKHDNFWATDLVYTSSAGTVTTKADIMKGFAADPAKPADKPAEPADTYSAEEILVRPFGEFAALNFRLVRHSADGAKHYYRNSGLFAHRDGRWQVVMWQATKEPEAPAK